MSRPAAVLRLWLDRLYLGCGALAAAFLVMLALVIMAGVLLRQIDIAFIGSDAYSGYCMAASSFLGLAYTFGRGDHIRVTLVLQRLAGRPRLVLEVACLVVGAGAAAMFAWYSVKMAWWSYAFHDVSQLNDATPLWIPQTGMAVGTSVLAIALLDTLAGVLSGRRLPEGSGAAEGGAHAE